MIDYPGESAPPSGRWSLEKRLRYQLLVPLAFLWVVGVSIAVAAVWNQINDVMDDSLVQVAERLASLPTLPSGAPADAAAAAPLAELELSTPVQYQLVSPDGQVLWRSSGAPAVTHADWKRAGVRTEGLMRVAVRPSADGARFAIAMEPFELRHRAMFTAVQALLLPLLLLLPVAALVVSYTLSRGFDSLETLRSSLAERPVHRLDPLPTADVPVELMDLVTTLNELLARVTRMMQAEKTLAANSAHELRTPLAATRAQVQVLLQELGPDSPGRERAATVLRRLDQLIHLTSKLMQLSRVESGLGLDREPLDLTLLARMVAGDFNAPGEQARLVVDPGEAPSWALGDVDALGIALRNLIENALRHSGSGKVSVSVQPDGAIAVEDEGEGVDAATLKRLKQPFQRGSSKADGHGLGLSIVDAVAQQSGGSLELESPVRAGRGFRATLRLEPIPDPQTSR